MIVEDSLHLDALAAQTQLRFRITGLARSEAFLRSPELLRACESLWSADGRSSGLLSELWLEPLFPAELSDYSLSTMPGISSALLSQLSRVGVLPPERRLYLHQAEAIEAEYNSRLGDRPGVIVTAPTGAGKTESFLLPLLNDLFSHPREIGATGVRAILLYPLNALVNDQVERLQKWLSGQDKVTFVHYTGETPNTNAGELEKERDLCRQLTRREAQRNPPDILVTNYSMLEYLLCRPQDSSLFGGALRTIVLDEAHLYNGSLAAEITFLLRRVLLRCGVSSEQTLQIATSATLGGNDEDLLHFARKLFSKANVRRVKGVTARRILPKEFGRSSPLSPDRVSDLADALKDKRLVGQTGLVQSSELCTLLAEHAMALNGVDAHSDANEVRPARFLHNLLECQRFTGSMNCSGTSIDRAQ